MAELNKAASEVMVEIGVGCATDVTGFGLLGHLAEMVVQSGVSVELQVETVPVFGDVLMFVEQDLISGAVERNREFASLYVRRTGSVSAIWESVLYDPQTSGGLLMAVEEDKIDRLLSQLKLRGVEKATIIGEVIDRSDGEIVLK